MVALGWGGAAVVGGISSLGAQERERPDPRGGPPILKLVTSTRALGLGGAFWTGGDADHAVFHHPGLISGRGFDLSLGVSRGGGGGERGDRYGRVWELLRRADTGDERRGSATKDAIHLALSASGAWLGGNVAAGLTVLDHGVGAGAGQGREREGGRVAGGRDDAVATASWGVTEFVGTVGYRRELFGFGVGAATKVIGWTAGAARARTVAVDAGVSRTVWRLVGALTVQNLGRDLKPGGRRVPLARRVVLGAGTRGRIAVGPLDVGGAVQVAREYGGDIGAGGGVEVAYWPIVRRVFIARVGVAGGGGGGRGGEGAGGGGLRLTFGAGFEGDRVRLDYGYGDGGGVGGPHRVGISIR